MVDFLASHVSFWWGITSIKSSIEITHVFISFGKNESKTPVGASTGRNLEVASWFVTTEMDGNLSDMSHVSNHQKFQVAKMEILNLLCSFCGCGFPYIPPYIQLI